LASQLCFFGIIYVSLKSKAIQSNTENLCISPLMVEHIAPLSGTTSAGANMALLGVDPGFHSVPLHRLNSKLDFVSEQAVVGIRYMLPDEDSPLLFGND
jgi:hypothetical protein